MTLPENEPQPFRAARKKVLNCAKDKDVRAVTGAAGRPLEGASPIRPAGR